MLREQQIQSAVAAILEAIADGVVVTDKNNRITVQRFGRAHLGLEAQQVPRRLDDSGCSARTHLIDTIRAWADKPDELYRRKRTPSR